MEPLANLGLDNRGKDVRGRDNRGSDDLDSDNRGKDNINDPASPNSVASRDSHESIPDAGVTEAEPQTRTFPFFRPAGKSNKNDTDEPHTFLIIDFEHLITDL